MPKRGKKSRKAKKGWSALSYQQKRVLGVLYIAWCNYKILLYPLLCLPKAIDFHRSMKLLRGIFGGNRSSKTTTAAADLVMFCLGLDFFRPKESFPNPPYLVWVITKDFEMAKTVTLKKILWWMPKDEVVRLQWSNTIHEIELKNGVLIQFRSWTQGYDSQKGREVKYILFDEEPDDEEFFKETEMRTIGSDWTPGEIVISMTPDKGPGTYVIKRVYDNETNDPQVKKWEFSSYDNFYINRAGIARAHKYALSQDPADVEMRIYGRPASRTGLVFRSWRPSLWHPRRNPLGSLIRDIPLKPWWRKSIAIDPSANHFAAVWFAVDGHGSVYVYRAMKWSDESPSVVAKQILNIKRDAGEQYEYQIIDGAEKAIQLELMGWGLTCISHREFVPNLEGVDKRGEKNAGIERVNYYLNGAFNRRLWVFESCEKYVNEVSQYVRKEDGDPQKRNDHFADCTRYYLSTFPAPTNLPEDIQFASFEQIEKRLAPSLEEHEPGDELDALYERFDLDLMGNPVPGSNYRLIANQLRVPISSW